jgi:hypothetical protein
MCTPGNSLPSDSHAYGSLLLVSIVFAGTTVVIEAGAQWDCPGRGGCASPSTQHVPAYPTPFWNQLLVLSWRALMAYIRNPTDVIGRLLLSNSVGLVIGLVFINANPGQCSPA